MINKEDENERMLHQQRVFLVKCAIYEVPSEKIDKYIKLVEGVRKK